MQFAIALEDISGYIGSAYVDPEITYFRLSGDEKRYLLPQISCRSGLENIVIFSKT